MVSVSCDTNQQLKKRTSKGKQKIEIKKVEKKESRQVMFTKRRQGLFKKCVELCSTYDSEFAAIAFSIAGKPFVSGYPSAERVIRRFARDSSQGKIMIRNDVPGAPSMPTSSRVTGDCSNWWDNPIDNLGLEDLEKFKTALEGLRDGIICRVDQFGDSPELIDRGCASFDDQSSYNEIPQLPDSGFVPPDVCLRDGIICGVDQFGHSPELIDRGCSSFDDQFSNYYPLVENLVPEFYPEFTGFAF